jgi:hypothetical protein
MGVVKLKLWPFSRGKNLCTHGIRGWVDPIAGLDDLEKRNLSLLGFKFRTTQPVA